MNEIQSYTSKEFGQVRTAEIDGKPYFMANDIALALGYLNTNKAVNDHCKHAVMRRGNDSLGRQQNIKFIPEGDVYRLIVKSKLPNAEKFEKWVFDEVIPTIRRTGSYQLPQTYAEALRALADKAEEAERLAIENEEMKPKAVFADAVAASDTSILIGELAKILNQNGVSIGQNRMFSWMREAGYLIRRGGSDYNMPTQRAMELGLFEIKERTINNPDGSIRITRTTKVTGKGQEYFVNKFLSR